MAKHIVDLHRTTLFTRPRHPGHVAAGVLALALLPALWPSDAAAHTCDAPFATDLVTGTGIDVGQVTVCNDAEFLTVTYETTWPWCVLKTNLHVARDLAGIPKIRVLGTPNWQRFDFVEDVDCEGEVTFDIPLDEIAGGALPGDRVVVAARAVVEGEGPDGTHPRCLLGDKCVGWGEGSRFRPRLPAMYFTYEVQDTAVACPEACIDGLEASAQAIVAGGFQMAGPPFCSFDTGRQAGEMITGYNQPGPAGETAVVDIGDGGCRAVIIGITEFVNLDISNAEQAACAPLAIDIAPDVDETNCDISPQ
jgi:hypothetical protein